MEVIFLMVLPAVLWAQSWYFLDLYSNTRTLGVISATAAIVLGGLVIFSGSMTALSTFVLLWAIYAAVASAVYLGGTDERTLGLYSLFLAVVTVLYVIFFLAGADVLQGTSVLVHWPMGIASIALAVFGGLAFFLMAPPYPGIRYITGWYTLVISIGMAVMGGLVVLGASVN